MARAIHKLTETKVRAAKATGRVSDGGGLYLNVTTSGSKSWLFMWVRDGRRREMGLGPYPAVTLARARSLAASNRIAVEEGRDPIAERDSRPEPTFGECADEFIDSIKSEWRNEKHAWQWRQTLSVEKDDDGQFIDSGFCLTLRDKRVSQITTENVLAVLKPIWTEVPETAARLRGRIERVLNYAKVSGWREGENPAAWANHLANLLPRRPRLSRGRQAAMPYADVPAFMQALRQVDALSARAMEVTVLCATRTGETLGMRWPELDFDKALWTIPAGRMKAGEEHVVPLSKHAIEILQKLRDSTTSHVYVFPGTTRSRKTGKEQPLSNMTMLMQLRRMGHEDVTMHGFRSSFRDWAGDETNFPREVAEAALAHKVGNVVEQAYRRSSAVEKRRKLMQAWADYLDKSATSNVVPMRRASRTTS